MPQPLPEHRQLRSGLCCAIADSRGHACAYERASHLTRDTLNGTAADATLSSDFQHTLAGPQLTLASGGAATSAPNNIPIRLIIPIPEVSCELNQHIFTSLIVALCEI